MLRLMAPGSVSTKKARVPRCVELTRTSLLEWLPRALLCCISSYSNTRSYAAFTRCSSVTLSICNEPSASPQTVVVYNTYDVFNGFRTSLNRMSPMHLDLCIPCRCFEGGVYRAGITNGYLCNLSEWERLHERNILAFLSTRRHVRHLALRFGRSALGGFLTQRLSM
jgi:hypothetical protein